jgi:predicted molibdopterin-dependent oxidoreductase YjgC
MPLLMGLANVMLAEKLLPEGTDTTTLQKRAGEWTPAKAAQETGVTADDITKAARLLANGPMAILVGKEVTEHPDFEALVSVLGDMIIATGNTGNLNIPGTECNTQGAMDMGILPDLAPGYQPISMPGMNTHKMLQAAANGELPVLWIVGAKLVEHYHDAELARRALETCPFVIVSELELTETAQWADLVLPAASVAEKDGTYTNCERRVQRIYKAFDISPDIKPDWLIFTEVAALLGGTPYFSARDILRDIAASVPMYSGITFKSLGETGVRWEYPQSGA